MTELNLFGFLGGLGMPEILVIVIALLVLFGARKIPEFMRGIGTGIREFKDASNNVKNDIQRDIEASERNEKKN